MCMILMFPCNTLTVWNKDKKKNKKDSVFEKSIQNIINKEPRFIRASIYLLPVLRISFNKLLLIPQSPAVLSVWLITDQVFLMRLFHLWFELSRVHIIELPLKSGKTGQNKKVFFRAVFGGSSRSNGCCTSPFHDAVLRAGLIKPGSHSSGAH